MKNDDRTTEPKIIPFGICVALLMNAAPLKLAPDWRFPDWRFPSQAKVFGV